MKLNPETIARASSRHPWRTVLVWVVVIAVSGFLSVTLLGDALTTDVTFTDHPESVRAQELLDEMRGEAKFAEFVVVVGHGITVVDPRYQQFVGDVPAALARLGPDQGL